MKVYYIYMSFYSNILKGNQDGSNQIKADQDGSKGIKVDQRRSM